MKKFLILVLVIFTATLVNAQIYDRGYKGSNSENNDIKENRNNKISDQVYLTANIAIPLLNEVNDYSESIRTGLGIDFGVDNYFRLPLPDKMRIGFDYGFSLHANPFETFEDVLLFFDTKLGFVYSYAVADKLTFDVKVTLKPTLLVVFEPYIGLSKGLGFYANYKLLRVGFEFSGGRLTDDIFGYSSYDIYYRRLDISLGFKF